MCGKKRSLRLECRPATRFQTEPQSERCAAPRVRLLIQQKQNRGRIFYRTPKTKPDVERDVAKRLGGRRLRSRAIRPKPPPCKRRSVACRHWSILRQRTQSNRSSFTPAASAE